VGIFPPIVVVLAVLVIAVGTSCQSGNPNSSSPATAAPTATADCDNPSANEMYYLKMLDAANINVAGDQGCVAIQTGNVICTDMRNGVRVQDENDNIWRRTNGGFTQLQAIVVVHWAHQLCPTVRPRY
jgi:hypothetical protein